VARNASSRRNNDHELLRRFDRNVDERDFSDAHEAVRNRCGTDSMGDDCQSADGCHQHPVVSLFDSKRFRKKSVCQFKSFFSAWRDFGLDCGKFRTVVSRSHPSGNRHRTCLAACDAHYFGARSVGKTRFHGRRGHDDDLLCACNRSDLWRNYSASF